jgi:hypothetical protein
VVAWLIIIFEFDVLRERHGLVGMIFLTSLKGRFWLDELRVMSLSLARGVAPLFIVLVVKFELYATFYLNKIKEAQL